MRVRRMHSQRKGQAMIETVLALVFVTFLFLLVFQVSHLLTARILLDHASARAARAKAVGFNDFMCLKTARVAMIPVAGKRLWPDETTWLKDDTLDESARVPIYLCADNESIALGLLEYERWQTMRTSCTSGSGLAPKVDSSVEIDIPRFFTFGDMLGDITIDGAAEIESHYPFYLQEGEL